jgi:ADP-heptose:LPS heptosyltransferase
MMPHIVVAPFSNSDIRDWPAPHFRALIALLVARWDGAIHVIGAPDQRIRAGEIVRPFDPRRVVNDCGRTPWAETMERIRSAACVVGNNSGIAHLAAFAGVPTLCIFSGAHQRLEWRPIGGNVVTLSRAIVCSPCHLHHAVDCPYGLACLDQIRPETVFEAVERLLDAVPTESFADVA